MEERETEEQQIKEMKIYLDRIEPLRRANNRIQLEWESRRLNAAALYQKRQAIRQALKKNDLWDDFKDKWQEKLEDHGHKKLDPQRNLFTEYELFEQLDELMDEMMDRIGMSGFEERESGTITEFPLTSGGKYQDEQ